MNAPVKIETSIEAKRAERNAIEAAQLANLAMRAKDLSNILRQNLGPMNPNLLWAQWHFYLALKDWGACDAHDEWFADICDTLNVDADGEPIGGAA